MISLIFCWQLFLLIIQDLGDITSEFDTNKVEHLLKAHTENCKIDVQ